MTIEGVGKVCQVATNVEGVKVGDIVFVEPTKAHKAGKIEADVLGTFGEYIVYQDANLDYNIFVLDPNIDLDLAPLVEPLSVGKQGVLCTNPQPTDNVNVSVNNDELPINGGIFMSEAKIIGSAGYTTETIKEVIDHLENNRTAIGEIITAKFAALEIETAMVQASDKQYKNIKVLLEF